MLAECLAGLKVLDLTQYIPGPFATQWMGDLGAQVVKVEPPQGDPMRRMGPVDGDGTTCFYKLANRNKRVINLDLKTEEGKQDFALLLERADILVEAYRPGVLDRLGFGRDRLGQINPRLIHCSLSGYGQDGPHARAAGHDLTYVALTGGLFASGTADRPVMTFPPLADSAGALMVLVAVLAALVRRGATGLGGHLDVSLAESALGLMSGVLTAAHRFGGQSREADLINGGAGFYRIYRTRDGRFMAVAPLEEKFWEIFCDAVGKPHWVCRQSEPMPQNELISDMEELFLTRDRDEWVALLAPRDCCVEPVLEPDEVASHPQWAHRGFLQGPRDGDDLIEVLLPMLLDGARARERHPYQADTAQGVLSAWR